MTGFNLYDELGRLQAQREQESRRGKRPDTLPHMSESMSDWLYVNTNAVYDAIDSALECNGDAEIKFTPEEERKLAELQLSRLDQPTTERLMARVDPDSDDFALLYDHWAKLEEEPKTWWGKLRKAFADV